MSDRARILVFTGDGKGKTTAALGMALRSAGHGHSVYILQFVKSNAATGELAAARQLSGVRIEQCGLGFVPQGPGPAFERHKAAAAAALKHAAETIAHGQYDLVVLDEVCFAVSHGLLTEQAVIDAVRAARLDSCVVLTGRGATPGLIELADTVTDMRCVKHALDAGRAGEKGVEI